MKAFSAAFGTSGAAPLFHLAGITPEAPDVDTALGANAEPATRLLRKQDLARAWRDLDSGAAAEGASGTGEVELVALGNPHLSLAECEKVARLCREGGGKADRTVTRTLPLLKPPPNPP